MISLQFQSSFFEISGIKKSARLYFAICFGASGQELCGCAGALALTHSDTSEEKKRFDSAVILQKMKLTILFIGLIVLPLDKSVEGQFQQSASILQGKTFGLF